MLIEIDHTDLKSKLKIWKIRMEDSNLYEYSNEFVRI